MTNEVGFNLGFYMRILIKWLLLGYGNYWTFGSQIENSILPMEPVLSKLKQLTPVSYEMTGENPDHIRSIGFIAQDVRKLFPGAVRVISDFNRKGPVTNDLNTMNYKYFGVLAIQALKEQWQQLKALEEEQAALLLEIDELQVKANALTGKK
ncbi:MAG: tail fiber domain-containing protein [Chitinophagaceae bacterium]|nr:tail fiber domain-containing protein [Chitinophagaceae bacterium]